MSRIAVTSCFAAGLVLLGMLGVTSSAAQHTPSDEKPTFRLATDNPVAARAAVRVQVAAANGKVNGPDGAGIDLTVGLAVDDGSGTQCGTVTDLVINVGDLVNFCYTVTNRSPIILNYHRIGYNNLGTFGGLFGSPQHALAPGESWQYNGVLIVPSDMTLIAIWDASDVLTDYTASVGTYDFDDISSTGTPLELAESLNSWAGITIPFGFTFYGKTSDQLSVSNNGGITFGNLTGPMDDLNRPEPGASEGPVIMPFWDDLADSAGNVYWEVRGSTPNRSVVVQWNRPHCVQGAEERCALATPGTINVQAILRENGTLSFQYEDMSFDDPSQPELDRGGSATVGLAQINGLNSATYSYNQPVLADASAIEWTYAPPTVYEAWVRTTVAFVAAPSIDVEPAAINAQAQPGGAPVTQELSIVNSGSADLNWGVSEAPSARAHFPRVPMHVEHWLGSDAGPATATDVAAAPLLAPARRGASKPRSASVLGAAEVPAYAFSSWTRTDFVSLDLSEPTSTLTSIVDPPPSYIYAAAFLDEDFSKMYVVFQAPHEPGVLEQNQFGTIDTATGAYTFINWVEGSEAYALFMGLRQDPTTGVLYGLTFSAPDSSFALATIDSVGGESSVAGYIHTSSGATCCAAFSGLAISPAGLMYTLDTYNESNLLVAVDKATAEVAPIGHFAFDPEYAQGMDFDASTGTLYWTAFSYENAGEVYTIDPRTGTETLVGPVQDGPELFGLAIAKPSLCTRPQDIPWLSINPTSGTTAPGASSAVTVTLDPSALGAGCYTANVCLFSDDPQQERTVLPVEFVVGTVAPAAVLAPERLMQVVEQGASAAASLSVTNTGTPGSHLSYDVAEAGADCAVPTDLAWLSATPTAGEVSPDAPASVAVVVDAANLEIGAYSASLCVTTDDSNHPVSTIPVELTVTPRNPIFGDGFDPRPVGLAIDDGSIESALAGPDFGQFLWLNRFTPDATTQLPFELQQVQVYWTPRYRVATGDMFDVYVYTDADHDPTNGAVLAASATGQTVSVNEAFQTIDLPTPLLIDAGSGDVLIAIVNRDGMSHEYDQWPAAIDTGNSQHRSWVGTYSAGDPSDAPSLPADATFSLLEDLGLSISGNWAIRGRGMTPGGEPVQLQ